MADITLHASIISAIWQTSSDKLFCFAAVTILQHCYLHTDINILGREHFIVKNFFAVVNLDSFMYSVQEIFINYIVIKWLLFLFLSLFIG